MKTKLEKTLRDLAHPGEYYVAQADGRVKCFACGHECVVMEGKEGVCKVRFNENGKLFVPKEYVESLNADPVEKKPLYHVLPGSKALSFGMLGCNFHCDFCQNWVISQVLKDEESGGSPRSISSAEIIDLALQTDSQIVASTYNEPLITSEWAVEIFKGAKQHGLKTAYISNGNANPRIIEELKPWLDCFKVDLKTFQDKNYRKLGGNLKIVLDTIRQLYEKGFWVELVTLIVPGFNDDKKELQEMAEFIRSVSPDIPWHVTSFHGDYKMQSTASPTAGQLIQAVEAGYQTGLHYVYAGNIPGQVETYENTFCPHCKKTVVKRHGFTVLENQVRDGLCPHCSTKIAGMWS